MYNTAGIRPFGNRKRRRSPPMILGASGGFFFVYSVDILSMRFRYASLVPVGFPLPCVVPVPEVEMKLFSRSHTRRIIWYRIWNTIAVLVVR